ncbi:unnamed protein product, partial [Ceratitis capitata]
AEKLRLYQCRAVTVAFAEMKNTVTASKLCNVNTTNGNSDSDFTITIATIAMPTGKQKKWQLTVCATKQSLQQWLRPSNNCGGRGGYIGGFYVGANAGSNCCSICEN